MKYPFLIAILALGTLAHAESFKYECTNQSGPGTDQTLVLNDVKIQVTSSDTMNGMNFNAKVDETYVPRNGAQKIRFLGKEKRADRAVIVYSKMTEGARMGYIQIQGKEDGFWSADYKCFRQ